MPGIRQGLFKMDFWPHFQSSNELITVKGRLSNIPHQQSCFQSYCAHQDPANWRRVMHATKTILLCVLAAFLLMPLSTSAMVKGQIAYTILYEERCHPFCSNGYTSAAQAVSREPWQPGFANHFMANRGCGVVAMRNVVLNQCDVPSFAFGRGIPLFGLPPGTMASYLNEKYSSRRCPRGTWSCFDFGQGHWTTYIDWLAATVDPATRRSAIALIGLGGKGLHWVTVTNVWRGRGFCEVALLDGDETSGSMIVVSCRDFAQMAYTGYVFPIIPRGSVVAFEPW